MLIIPPPIFKKRRPRGKRAKAVAPSPPPPPPPPPPTVMVTSVTTVVGDGYKADFHFSEPVTVIGQYTEDLWVTFPIFGQEYPLESEQISPTIVRFTFGDDSVAPGIPWHVEIPPSNLELNGLTMPAPQDGEVQE